MKVKEVKQLTDEQKVLVEQNIKLAYYMAHKLKGHSLLEFEDLIATCFEGLCKAASKYNPKRGIKFATFATTVIQNHVFMANRICRNDNKKSYLEDLSMGGGGFLWEEQVLIPQRKMDDAVNSSTDIGKALHSVIPTLTDRQKTILALLIDNPDISQKQIAQMLKLSQAQISRLLMATKAKILKAIAGEY